MKLLLASLVALIPLTVYAGSRGGISVGGLHGGGAAGIGMHRMESRMPPTHSPSFRGLRGGLRSGGAVGFGKQRMERRMPASRLPRFRGLRGRLILPWIGYAPVPDQTIVNVQIQEPEPPPPPPKPPAPAKFWTERCGVFVELEVGPKMNLMEEEQKDCAQ